MLLLFCLHPADIAASIDGKICTPSNGLFALMHLHLHLYLWHLADAFVQSELQQVYLSQERNHNILPLIA